MSLIVRYILEQKLNQLLSKQMVSVADYRNGDLSLTRLRAMIHRIHRDMIIEIDRTHKRTKLVYAQTHNDTNAHKGAGGRKRRSVGMEAEEEENAQTHKRTPAPTHKKNGA